MKQFYDTIRPMFGGKLRQDQVEALEFLVKNTADMPLTHRAYLFATVFLETGMTMRPIHERGRYAYFDKYDVGRLAAVLGNTPERDGDGYKYRGRGYVQITGYSNYKKAKDALGIDFVKDPDLALVPENAIKIIKRGMTEGWFTGKKLSDYLSSTGTKDYVNARRIVNGTDKATTIANYAEVFEKALATLPKPSGVFNGLLAFLKIFWR